jgi:hypothetical protein
MRDSVLRAHHGQVTARDDPAAHQLPGPLAEHGDGILGFRRDDEHVTGAQL